MQLHWKRLAAFGGVAATYSQDGSTVELTVVPAGRTTRTETAEGAITSSKDSDFVLLASSLVIGGNVVSPKRRDKITYADVNGMQRKFEVVSQAGERHYDPVDQYGVMIRVHTVEVKGT
jgi:hypothetical protein